MGGAAGADPYGMSVQLNLPLKIEFPSPKRFDETTHAAVIKTTLDPKIRFTYTPTGLSQQSETITTVYYMKDGTGLEEVFQKARALHAIQSEIAPAGTVHTIDLAKAGSESKSTAVYIVAKNPKQGALLLRPTDHLTFNWKKLKVRWKK